MRRSCNTGVKDDRGVTQGAVGNRYGNTTDEVVGDFMPGQDLKRVGLGFAVHLQSDHRLGGGIARCGSCEGNKLWCVDGWNTVPWWATGEYFVIVNNRAVKVTKRKLPAPRRRILLGWEQSLRIRTINEGDTQQASAQH